MNKKSITQSRPQSKLPSVAYPELTAHLAEISKTSYKLYELTKPEVLGNKLNVSKQALQYHIDKLKGGSK